jgi:Mg-chelatase subunit ChlD
MKGTLLSTLILSMVLSVWSWSYAKEEGTSEPAAARVEVVFVLDTTGSMGGLIQAAKEKVWAIANTLVSAKPAPDIKMGLVGYRDRGDAYVTKVTDLTDDLDAVYEKLMGFQAQGGGDTPESVNRALHEAVTKITWSKDDDAYRVIFLVGDCPPHMDYKDDVKYPESCKTAATAGLIINTIQCGNHTATVPIWRDIADRAEGRYFRVEQSGGAILASTPFDEELSELSRKMDESRLYYGDEKVVAESMGRKEVADRIHARGTITAKARRAAYSVSAPGKSALLGAQELLRDLEEGRVKLHEVKEEELPEELKKLEPEEREKFIAEKSEQRKKIEAKIKDLSAKRQKHIEEQLRKAELKGKQSLDFAIFECIKEQAARKGIEYEGGPAL